MSTAVLGLIGLTDCIFCRMSSGGSTSIMLPTGEVIEFVNTGIFIGFGPVRTNGCTDSTTEAPIKLELVTHKEFFFARMG